MGNRGIIYPYMNHNSVLVGKYHTAEICTVQFQKIRKWIIKMNLPIESLW